MNLYLFTILTATKQMRNRGLPWFVSHYYLPSTASMRDVRKAAYCTHAHTMHTPLGVKSRLSPDVSIMIPKGKQARVQTRK